VIAVTPLRNMASSVAVSAGWFALRAVRRGVGGGA
jgi:hypothetical protein